MVSRFEKVVHNCLSFSPNLLRNSWIEKDVRSDHGTGKEARKGDEGREQRRGGEQGRQGPLLLLVSIRQVSSCFLSLSPLDFELLLCRLLVLFFSCHVRAARPSIHNGRIEVKLKLYMLRSVFFSVHSLISISKRNFVLGIAS